MSATDLTEFLVGKGVAFREAYDQVGKLVARAAELGVALNKIPDGEIKTIAPILSQQTQDIFNPRKSLAKRGAPGAPSPDNVSDRIKYWREQLG
jgi:argininosuccinate lyase